MKKVQSRHTYLINRNKEICNSFWNAYLSGYKFMDIYTQLAEQYGVSVVTIRRIVADRDNWQK